MAEELRITGYLSDMWMKYIPCPSLCRQCKHFETQATNWPFHCHGNLSSMASYKAKSTGGTYDDCTRFEEK